MIRLLITIVLILAALVPAVVFGAPSSISAPDSLSIVSANCYGGLIETGDVGCLTHYDIDYTSVPAETADDAFLNSFTASSTTAVLRSSQPYVFVNSGYGQGAVHIYFDAADVAALGIVWGAAHMLTVTGNPAVFAIPPTVSTNVNWVQETGGGSAFGNGLTTIAGELEVQTEWSGVDLVVTTANTGTVLQASGEDYFANVVPNLREISPDVFSSTQFTPEFREREFTRAGATSLESQFDNTALSSTFDGLTTFLGTPEIMTRAIIVFILTMAVWGITFWQLQGIPNGDIISALTIAPMLGGSAALGFLSLAVLGVIGLFCLLIIGIAFIQRIG